METRKETNKSIQQAVNKITQEVKFLRRELRYTKSEDRWRTINRINVLRSLIVIMNDVDCTIDTMLLEQFVGNP